MVTVLPVQNVVGPLMLVTASGTTLTAIGLVTTEVQPVAFVEVYEMVAEPLLTPLTVPFVDTEATPALLDDQTPPVVVLERGVVAPIHTELFPAIGSRTGKATTAIVTGAAIDAQPCPFVTDTP